MTGSSFILDSKSGIEKRFIFANAIAHAAGISCRSRARARAAPPAPSRGLFRENVIVLDAGMDGVHDRELIKKKKYPLSLVTIRLLNIARMFAFF
jgi:hypothetical protein